MGRPQLSPEVSQTGESLRDFIKQAPASDVITSIAAG